MRNNTPGTMKYIILVVSVVVLQFPGLASAQVTDASSRGPELSVDQEEDANTSDVPEFGLGLRVGWLFAPERDRDPLFESDTSPMTGLLLDVKPFESFIPNDRLRLGLEWVTSTSDVSLFQIFSASYTDHHLFATAEYGYQVLDWLVPYLRVGAGAAFYDIEVNSGESLTARDHWLFSSYASAGIEFVSPGWTVDFGGRIEGGYALRQAPEFTLESKRQTPEDEADIPLQGTPIGQLPTSGGLLTLEIFVRY